MNTPIAATGAFIKDRRDTVRRFTRALVEGIFVYKTQREFSKRVIAKYMRVNDPDAVEDSYRTSHCSVQTLPAVGWDQGSSFGAGRKGFQSSQRKA